MTELADRVQHTDISGIRRVFDLAAGLKDPVNFSIGQPDFDVPEPIQDALAEAVHSGQNGYSQTQGIPALREALKEHLGREKVADEQLLVTSAVSGGLTLAFLALLNPGAEILLPDPYFVSYKQIALMLGATPVYVDTYPDFKMTAAAIAEKITPRTKVLCLNNPANPTGAVLNREELTAVAELCRKHNLLVIADEIYETFTYDAPLVPFRELYDNTLTLAGFSKSHAMTGWRLGYAIGPAPLIGAMTKFQQFTYVCATHPVQVAGIEALKTDMSEHVQVYKAKRDRVYEGLVAAGYEVEKPGGAFYLFPRVPWSDCDDSTFVEACIKNNLLVIPGSVFSEAHTHFRISYAVSDETIDRGLAILADLRSGQK